MNTTPSILRRTYFSQCQSARDVYATGEAYLVIVDEKEFITGYFHGKHTYLMDEKFLKYFTDMSSPTPWESINFNQISLICQKELVNQMGSLFPWEYASWKSHEDFMEYWEPQTLEGIINKSLREPYYFFSKVVCGEHTKLVSENTTETIPVQHREIPNHYHEDLVTILGRHFRYKWGYLNSWFGHLEEISDLEYTSLRNVLKKREEEQRQARKEFAKNCGLMARKYGIPFEISLRCFKGNEASIKNFVESLKNAFGKEYSSHELTCGRRRREAEIERLGIQIGYVDANHIADYILSCLEAGKILNHL